MRVNISSEGDRAFQALFNASLDAMLLADDSGHYLDANPAACQLFGLEREQIIGRCIQDFSAIEFDVEQAWQDFLDRGQEQGQFSLIRLDGEVREVDYTATAHLLPHVHLSILRDITPESPPQPVSEAPGADERLERIACHVPGIIYQFCLDPDGTMSFPYTSEAVRDIYGVSPREVERDCRAVFDVLHPDDLERVYQSIQDSAAQLSLWSCEYRVNHPNGRQFWLLGQAMPQPEANGRISWYGYIRDITSQKVSQLALQSSENKFRHVIETINDMVFILDPDGSFSYVSPTFKTVMGYELTAFYRQPFNHFVHPEDLDRCLSSLQRVLNRESVSGLEYRVLHRDGQYYWHRANLAHLQEPGTEVSQCLGIASYIDDSKQAQLALQESKARLDFVLEAVGEGTWEWDLQANTVTYSQEWPKLLGCRLEDLTHTQQDWDSRLHPDDRVRAYEEMNRYLSGQTQLYESEHRLRCGDGSYKWILSRGKMIERDEAGNPVRLMGLFRDISERKANEAVLAELTDTLRQAQEVAHIGHWSFNLLTEKMNWSAEVFRIFGLNPEEPEPTFSEYLQKIHPDDRDYFSQRMAEAATGIPQNFDHAIILEDGQTRYLNSRIQLESQHGEVLRMFGTMMDITERKTAELESERFFTVGLDLLCIAGVDSKFRRLNRAWETTLGYQLQDLEGKSFLDLVHPDDLESTMAAIADLDSQTIINRFVNRYRDKQGNYHSIEWIARPHGELIYAAARDITERLETEAALQALVSRAHLLSTISDEIRNSLDLDKILQNAVRAITAEVNVDICTFGWYKDLELPPTWEVVKEQRIAEIPSWLGFYSWNDFPILFEHILADQIYCLDVEDCQDIPLQDFCHQSGIHLYLALPVHTASGQIGGFEMGRVDGDRPWETHEIELLHEIAAQVAIAIQQAQLYEESRQKTEALEAAYQELQETQVQLIQAEKMSSLGQLVGGVAHEINNPVSFIYGNLTHVAEYVGDLQRLLGEYKRLYGTSEPDIARCMKAIELDFLMEDLPKTLASMKVGAERIRDIVKSLRTFSRLDEADFKEVNLHENLDSTLLILQNRLNGRGGTPEIDVIKDYGDLPKVACYSGLLNQVFMNLLINAIDAIEEQQRVQVDSEGLPYQGQLTLITRLEAEIISIQIQDNGIGMTPQIQEKIFNPFFTTKPIGSGTGMGLSTSYQIITQNHQGQLSCHSVPGQGSCFVIRLPRVFENWALMGSKMPKT
ncbi:PAS domain-containing protein [Phormidium yuhuli AB48]|uniref:histidine kinase n=1 Tax=Phormidium yuhuli AB48 TaxID=2940671 RepID=A0ABY5APR0_9CYAN|nr:PAS domain-containing protein [Phormidium yuhuli]USR90234.1 PAS domain-containing protein [Phormidium yuhuli AB48]